MNSLGTLLKLPEFYLLGGIFRRLLYFAESLSGLWKFLEVFVFDISLFVAVAAILLKTPGLVTEV